MIKEEEKKLMMKEGECESVCATCQVALVKYSLQVYVTSKSCSFSKKTTTTTTSSTSFPVQVDGCDLRSHCFW